ncbi:hypothetical protein [Streptomyces sp. NBC_01750]|uniref:hypothetical protein n=1 Tax=Streptomyces sp. NBC_01750 TaxID=2975928 RepID=UPI002DD9E242|nr:hypothetical protein [Streptomyces sp. NBC_01750]WSD36858.1 hypothetical protein OG966_36125 [Streptomyces sp. NBC_01750]
MTYNAEHAKPPQVKSPVPAAQSAPRAPRTEPDQQRREPVISADGPVRTSGPEPQLLPQGERDKLAMRLQQALNNFVDSPRQAVVEADSAFDEVTTHLTNTLAERRRALRASWQSQDTEAKTEDLRLALRQYREITERLLRM